MTHTPNTGAPPRCPRSHPSQPPAPAHPAAGAPLHPPRPPHPLAPARRRTAFAEGVDRLRHAATTEPGRLRVIGAALAALVVAFGAVTAWQMTDRAAAADAVLTSSQPLTSDAADIYRSLADANTAASSGFLAGGQESAATRDRYERDIATAAAKLVNAAANAAPAPPPHRRSPGSTVSSPSTRAWSSAPAPTTARGIP